MTTLQIIVYRLFKSTLQFMDGFSLKCDQIGNAGYLPVKDLIFTIKIDGSAIFGYS